MVDKFRTKNKHAPPENVLTKNPARDMTHKNKKGVFSSEASTYINLLACTAAATAPSIAPPIDKYSLPVINLTYHLCLSGFNNRCFMCFVCCCLFGRFFMQLYRSIRRQDRRLGRSISGHSKKAFLATKSDQNARTYANLHNANLNYRQDSIIYNPNG